MLGRFLLKPMERREHPIRYGLTSQFILRAAPQRLRIEQNPRPNLDCQLSEAVMYPATQRGHGEQRSAEQRGRAGLGHNRALSKIPAKRL